MAKQKTLFECTQCHAQTTKWYGCCPSCQAWNTIGESQPSTVAFARLDTRPADTRRLSAVANMSTERMTSGIKEWDRVMGGGIMPGSLLALTGDPGIGKSTLLLQVAHAIAQKYPVLYFSSEESLEQVKLRAQRLGCLDTAILFSDNAYLDEMISTALSERPQCLIIDSIQNCYQSSTELAPGSMGQLKDAVFKLMRLAKEQHIAILMTAHITKDGVMAGPKMLEHMVDAVFYLQGEDRWQTRILRAVKNRFGTVNELGFFEMEAQGLQEIPHINHQLLQELGGHAGSVLVSSIEGTRPILIELQSLVIASKYGTPQRVVSGVDQTQVVLIAAILEKYLKIPFNAHDIFFKVSGGLKIRSSALDLGIALSLLSSYFNTPLPSRSIALAELSLTGQIKPINHLVSHLSEMEKFGIKNLYVAHAQKGMNVACHIVGLHHVYELTTLFESSRM